MRIAAPSQLVLLASFKWSHTSNRAYVRQLICLIYSHFTLKISSQLRETISVRHSDNTASPSPARAGAAVVV